MPRQRNNYFRDVYDFPADFPERLRRFQAESGLSWSEIARRLGTYRSTVGRRKEGRGRPNTQHMMALLDLAESLGLRHVLTDWGVPHPEGPETQEPHMWMCRGRAAKPGAVLQRRLLKGSFR